MQSNVDLPSELVTLKLATHDFRASLLAYTAGVNAGIETCRNTGRLPIEFVLTRFSPAPWEPLDTLSYGRYLAFSLAPHVRPRRQDIQRPLVVPGVHAHEGEAK